MRVLIIEDDAAIAAGIADALDSETYEVRRADTGAGGLAAVADFHPELVILDLGLPDLDGTEVCRRIREHDAVPIIVVSARGDEADRVLALELGADDYLTKPFGMRELLARLRALARRSGGAEPTPASAHGALNIDARSRRVTLGDEEVHLTPTEFDLLSYLAADSSAVLRRQDILRDVWKTEWYGATKTLDAHVAAIRRKLGDASWIQSVRGIGFRFEPPKPRNP
ncbi:MAG: response regulator transcription factor [Pseudolysinimonas sp.]|uniref:response regulator transcription factor n=1 Tax=Pseudolysinimonas sp. TaxID=2680009 RepID=UPI0032655B38